MNKATGLLIGLFAAGTLAFTNPSLNDYQDFMRQEIIKQSRKSGEASLERILGPLLGGFAGGLIASQTIREDYIFFSTYELSIGKKRLRALGIAKKFVVLEVPS
ncbi:MAG: DUF4359 domain-containing protein [Desulfobacteraceae bacterium]|nr:DUF4359 domain-containing protein [Desulfobacteraceae bacterium]